MIIYWLLYIQSLIIFPAFLFQDDSDVVFKATSGKWRAVVVEISRMHKTGRPVLVGTTSVEQSDTVSMQLREAGIPHEVSFFPPLKIRFINLCFSKSLVDIDCLSCE